MIKTRFNLKLFIIVVTLILKNNASEAQKLFLSPEETFAEAKEYLLSEEPEEALPLFLELIDKDLNTASVNYFAGYCFLRIRGQKEKAIAYLEKAAVNISKKYSGEGPNEDIAPPKTLFLLGEAYQISGNLEKSIGFYTKYAEYLETDTFELNLVKLRIKQCENAGELMNAKVETKTVKLNDAVNNGVSSSRPVLSADEGQLFYMKKLKFYDAVMHSVKQAADWADPENITPEIKSDGDFYITGVSSDGNTLFLFAYDNYTKGDIYTTTFNGKKWSDIKKLNGNINTVYNESSASISSSGKTLYFASNRKGGFGGLDLYKSEMDEKGEWGPAVNLGPLINTMFNEDFPFVTSDENILCFTSQGHYNMGGYDVFYATRSTGNEWQYPLNIGYPVNTTDDDDFFFPVGNGRSGYQAKPGNSGNGISDIYRYELLDYARPARYLVKGKVNIPDNSRVPKNEIVVTVIEKQDKKQLGSKNCDSTGTYAIKLPSGNFLIDFSTASRQLDEKELYIPEYMDLDEIILQSDLKYEIVMPMTSDSFMIRDILFSFDKYTVPGEDFSFLTALTALFKKYPALSLKLNGYTDSKGPDSYNLKLSVMRANEIKDFLIKSGIESQRIRAQGFGEILPVAVNQNADGSDNPEGRKYNRRVEIEISGNPDTLIIKKEVLVPAQLKLKN